MLRRRLITRAAAVVTQRTAATTRVQQSGAPVLLLHQRSGSMPVQRPYPAQARAFHTSGYTRLAEIIMDVPSMGDSITEGTIKVWEKQVGEAVAVDEVVVVIETDKVSVDIRAKHAGVLVEQYAAVDDNVEVGAKLLKIDTTATPSATPAAAPAPKAAAPAAAASSPPPPPPSADHHAGARKPLIKFLGKRSLLGKGGSAALTKSPSAAAPAVRYEDIKGTPGALTFAELPPMYGRPVLSEAEMEAIESGGATL